MCGLHCRQRLSSSISGASVGYGGGGGAGVEGSGSRGLGATSFGGGNGSGPVGSPVGSAGTANTGGGGGGGDGGNTTNGFDGGSGIVVVSYSGNQKFIGGTVTSSGGNTIHTFTSSGTLTGNIATDYSPQGNNWTPNNISLTTGSTYDLMTDVPTLTSTTVANYCTLNAVLQAGGYTLNDGNLNWARTGATGGGSDRSQFGTIGVTSGKWYWEFTAGTTNANSLPAFGIAIGSASTQLWAGSQTGAYIYNSDGTKTISGTSSSYGATFATGDIIGVAFDADAGTLTFYNNNTSQGTAASGLTSGPYFPAVTRSVGGGGSNGTEIANFGQRPFAYTPPTNFLALNTFNL